MNAWIALTLAILTEVAATLALKSAGEGSVPATVVVVAGYLASFVLLAIVLRSIEVGTTYAIWAGAGTALIATIGIVALGESASPAKFASLGLIIAGVIGLNLAGAH